MFTIKIAEHFFTIDNKYQYVFALCRDYITPPNENAVYIQASEDEIDCSDKSLIEGFSHGYLEGLAIYEKICRHLIKQNIQLFHCSSLKIDGRAYLFTAPSGTGKSTHARLWREYFGSRVTMINDDKPLISFNNNEIRVYGTPYCGKHGIQTNTSGVVSGIIILNQAQTNSIKRLTPKEAFPRLMEQSYRVYEPDEIVKTIDMIHAMSRLPVFSMGCTISAEAVKMAYNALKGAENET